MSWAEQPHAARTVAASDALDGSIDVDLDDTGDVDILDVDDAIAARVADGSVTLPAFPSILADLGASSSPASVVERDLALVAAVVRLAQSDGLQSPTTAEAVAHLGPKRLSKVAFATSLSKSALAPGPLVDVRRRVWRACLASAVVAEAIAEDHGVAGDVAFLAGLLHDFGQIVALALIEETVVDAKPDARAWLDVVDRFHCDLGQLLAESWSLPQPIPAVIGGHHQTLKSGRIAILDVVHAVDCIVAHVETKPALTLDEIDALPVVASRAQAALVLRALDKLPAFVAALAPSPKRAVQEAVKPKEPDVQPIGAIALEKPLRVQLKTVILGQARIEGLTTTMVSRNALALTSKHPLPKGWVTRLEVASARAVITVWVTVVESKVVKGVTYAEAKPFALHAGPDGWPAFVETLRSNA